MRSSDGSVLLSDASGYPRGLPAPAESQHVCLMLAWFAFLPGTKKGKKAKLDTFLQRLFETFSCIAPFAQRVLIITSSLFQKHLNFNSLFRLWVHPYFRACAYSARAEVKLHSDS